MHPPVMTSNGYPTSDGKPMAETDLHRLLMTDLIHALHHWFAEDEDTYVSGNLLIFYEEGNKRRHVSPDVFVVFGVPKHIRPNYLLWEEGAAPSVVIELTSSSTRREDTQTKMTLYRELGINEYFLFDPNEDYLSPSFQGYRLTGGEYRPIRVTEGRLRSRQLGLLLERDGTQLRLVDPETGQRLSTTNDDHRAAEAERESRRIAEQAAEAERETRRQAEQAAEAERESRRIAEQAAEAERETRRQAEQAAEAEREARRMAEQAAEAERESRRIAEQAAEAERETRRQAEQAAEAEREARLQAEQAAEAERETRRQAEQAAEAEREARLQAEQVTDAEREARLQAEREIERLKRELDEFLRRTKP